MRHLARERALRRLPPGPRVRSRARGERLRRAGRGSRALREAPVGSACRSVGYLQGLMSGPFLSTATRSSRRPRRALTFLAAVVLVLAAVAGAFGIVALLERDAIPRGTTIGGVDVGGMDEETARVAVSREAGQRLTRPIELSAEGRSMTTSGDELGAKPLIDDALALALDAGSTERVLARVGVRSGAEIPLEYRLAPVRAAELGNRIDDRLGDPPRDARVV